MKVTEAFIDKLENDKFISEGQADRMKNVVNGTSANANGYDVCHDEETKLDGKSMYEDRDINILAEVKCNLPVNKNTFGSDQKKGIIKDINGLLGNEFNSDESTQSNKTTRKSSFDTKEYYKFMVFLNYKNEEQKSVKNSVENLKKNLEEGKDKANYDKKLELYEGISKINKDKVYIVFIKI